MTAPATEMPLKRFRPNYLECEWWSVYEAMNYTGKSRETIYAWMRENRFAVRPSTFTHRIYGSDFKHYADTGESCVMGAIQHSTA